MSFLKPIMQMYVLLISLFVFSQAHAFVPLAGNMSNYDPADLKYLDSKEDSIRLGIFYPFSGPAAINGDLAWVSFNFAVHDINSQGGVNIGGKKMKIYPIKGDHQMKPAPAKRAAEKLYLEDNVKVIFGSTGTHITLIAQKVAYKYKKLFWTVGGAAEMLMDGKNFHRYVFRPATTNAAYAYAMAYYAATQKPYKKYYVLCQDYAYGHSLAGQFKEALAKYRPEAQIVGYEFHQLWLKDFAPFISKIMGSGAEVVFTGDFPPDTSNLLKAKEQLGMKIPLMGPFVLDINTMRSIKDKGINNLVPSEFVLNLDIPSHKKMNDLWVKQWKSWKDKRYSSLLSKYPNSSLGSYIFYTYMFFDAIERAGSLDEEKIIAALEGHTYKALNRSMYIRPCDHQGVQDMYVAEMVHPNIWYEDSAGPQKVPFAVPARYATPVIPKDLDRCKGVK